jgi:cytoplasmic iron level regulating protein YaaA (DUF328/UPF0246 family)
MIILVSPAKTLDYQKSYPFSSSEMPRWMEQSETIVKKMKGFSAKKLMDLMDISKDLADLNVERFQEWSVQPKDESVRPAIFAFAGEVYSGLDAHSMTEEVWQRAQKHLRLLSGLYGALRPHELIQPYRLEMGTQVSVGRKKNLVEFWKTTVTKSIKEEMEDGILVNLASAEYARVVDFKSITNPVIECQFLEFSNGKYKPVQFFLKKARGLMARYLLDVDAKTLDDIRGFDREGYRWSEAESSGNKLVFLRG